MADDIHVRAHGADGGPTLLVAAPQADLVRPRWVAACREARGDAPVEPDTGAHLAEPATVAGLIPSRPG